MDKRHVVWGWVFIRHAWCMGGRTGELMNDDEKTIQSILITMLLFLFFVYIVVLLLGVISDFIPLVEAWVTNFNPYNFLE